MPQRLAVRVLIVAGILVAVPLSNASAQEAFAQRKPGVRVVKADISPPLRSIPTKLILNDDCGALMVDPGEFPEQRPGTETDDPVLQDWTNWLEIPSPTESFNGPPNLCGCSPPDPNGAVGPNHFVAMDNLHYAIYDKSGALLFGPTANNTLWAGFGGACETSNSGDPIVLYDQVANRWLLTQFTAGPAPYLNCVALSTSGDPLGTYQRYAVATGSNFPDYPKYGVWSDGYYISTREFPDGGGAERPGAYAMDRTAMLAGSLSPVVIGFVVVPGSTPAYNYGMGLLPSDLDGFTPPPAGSPNYYIGSMDDGGGLGAPQDALSIWEFHADFVTPGSSTFTFQGAVPISPYDTIFGPCSGRNCIPQPGTANRLDILSYRQRPLFRAAYRNFGSHESIVTNQSVEAVTGIAGIRWWELRDPGGSPTIFQEGTYAPGATDGIHRWMGSIAQDSAGNMALGYSASDPTSTFPSVWYTGRLVSDPLNTMPQGEGFIHNGTGSQTSSQRWGDYTSMVVDPTDDCTFWYTNEYIPVTSGAGWQLRIGSFRFAQCGTPDFTISPDPLTQAVCAPSDAVYTVNLGSISGFTNPVFLSALGNPSGTSVGFSTNPVTPPGSSTMTVSGTGGATPGSSTITITGTAPGPLVHTADVGLDIVGGAPGAPTLTSPANGANNVPVDTMLVWSAVADATEYLVEVDDDPGFGSPEFSTTTSATSVAASGLSGSTTYNWRVTASNACGAGSSSAVFTFMTVGLPGDCPTGTVPNVIYDYGFESGAGGWTVSGTGASNWALSPTKPHSGTMSYFANDIPTVSDQRLESPDFVLPTGQNPLSFQFWNDQEMEDSGTGCYDGGILEISTNGGSTWTQLLDPVLQTDPYDGLISSSFGNPLAGLNAWCGDPQPYLNSIVDLDAYAGMTVRLRIRFGTDNSVSHPGWYVDDVKVQGCVADTMPFIDGFESGDTSAWSVTVP